MSTTRCILGLSWIWLACAGLAAAERSLGDPALLSAPPAQAPGFPSRAADLDVLPGFQNPPPGYGEVPFWWWTGDPLDPARLSWQIEELHKKGLSGMQVNYAHEDTSGWPTYASEPEIFSDAWWTMWKHVADECSKRGMGIGLSGYTLDWPNGKSLVSRTIYGDPEIQGRELVVARKHRAKAGQALACDLPAETVAVRAYPVSATGLGTGNLDLGKSVQHDRLEWDPPQGEWEVWIFTAARKSGTLNPLHPQAGRRVVEKFFQPFQDHAPGQSAAGLNYFFQDELQFGVGDRIWTDDLAAVFQDRKGYSLFDALPAMFQDVGPPTAKYRLDFMDVKMQLAQERYFIPIFQWHWSRGKIYGCDPGSRGTHPTEFGDYFSAIRWYTAPGHDTPGGQANLIKGKVSSSIAQLYQRPRVWLEGYHSLGWGATPENLMFATRENYLYGCNLLNLHGLYYSTHGSFWEWAPPCHHFRMPYWEHLGTFLKYFERLSYVMSQGAHQCDVAVIYPVSPGQAQLGGAEATSTAFAAGSALFQNGYDFVFLDDESLARSQIRDGRLHVSGASYRVLILPALRAIRWASLEKARDFFRAGGIVLAIGALPEASDRAGSQDATLDTAVKELVGVTAVEARTGGNPPQQKNAAGGVGLAILAGEKSPVRQYDGGFAGRWAWSKEPAQQVYFKAVWNRTPETPQTYRVRFFCDNEGALYLNNQQLCARADYGAGWSGEVQLKNGDVLTIDARDHDAPGRRCSAGTFLALAKDGQTVFSTEDLRYTLVQPKDDSWRTSTATAGLAAPDITNVHEAHRGAAAGDVASQVRDTVQRLIPRAVQAEPTVRAAHRKAGPRDVYLVMGAAPGTSCTFQAIGRAELWDAWTGQTRPLQVLTQTAESTTVRLPLEAYETQLVVFTPGQSPALVPETTLTEITHLETADGKVTVTGYADTAGEQTATVRLGARQVTLRGNAGTVPAPLDLDGNWEFQLQPTLDNRWGDFRLPVTEKLIGAEARIFRHAAEPSTNPGWQARDFDDSRWSRVTHGFGLKFWKLGPLPTDGDIAALDAKLAALASIDPVVPVEIGGKRYSWMPYAFSWRWGLEGDPGHQGWHGLKENVSDDFIRLGQPKGGHNETQYTDESAGTRYYLWTAAVASKAIQAELIAAGERKPAAVYVNGAAVPVDADHVALRAGANPLLLRYDRPGRGHVVLVASDAAPHEPARTPLAMSWYDRPGVLAFDACPEVAQPAGWYRFVAPPGLRGLTVTAYGTVQGWADGESLTVTADSERGWPQRYRLTAASLIPGQAQVALRVESPRGYYGGAAIPEPIQLDCGVGTTALGDWSQGSALDCYSGGAWYRKSVTLTAEQLKHRVLINLGQVVATAEVRVNGRVAGIRVAPPWTVDVTEQLQAGENRLEILVYNTLANHYQTIPTKYRGKPTSGLLGPVQLEFVQEVTLR